MAAAGTNLEGLRVFVSYPRGGLGHTWAEKVQRHLENLGAELWRDEASIREGEQDWYRRIEEGLEKSALLIGIVGQDTDHCAWQQREMLRAIQRRKPIVALRIAAVGLPLYIQEKQPVELRQNDSETLAALTAAIIAAWEQCNPPPAADEAPTSAAGIDAKPLTLQRQREIAYLKELIYSEYSDREDRYVPVEGKER